MPDREKVISVYECCKNPWNRKCDECPIEKDCCHDGLPTFEIKEALKLLKEQEKQKFFVDKNGEITPLPVVVRCKDCKHRGNSDKCVLAAISKEKDFPLFMLDNRGEWFCADGEREDSNGEKQQSKTGEENI